MLHPVILNLQFESVEPLRRLYMPFVTDGGLFVPSNTALPGMGDELFLTLSLPRLAFREATLGRVVWLRTHDNLSRQGERRGFGVQFCGADNRLRSQLESLLAARLNDPEKTCTM